MEVELSIGKIFLKEITWGEELDCYEKSEIGNGQMKNTVFERYLEIAMTGKKKEWIDALNREDGLKLRKAVKQKFKESKSEEDKKN